MGLGANRIDVLRTDDLKKTGDDFRRKDVFEFRPYNATRVEIKRGTETLVFEKAKGTGVLATTDLSGQVNQAIYAKPLFLDKDDGTCSFVMANRLTHDNVGHNPSASSNARSATSGCSDASPIRTKSSKRSTSASPLATRSRYPGARLSRRS